MAQLPLFLMACFGLALLGIVYLWCRNMAVPARPQYRAEMKSSVQDLSRARPLMEMEMERARRLGYTLAIIAVDAQESDRSEVVLASPDSRNLQKIGGESCGVDAVLQRATLLQETLRMIDIPAYDEENQRIVIMLPGSNNVHASQTAIRISDELQKKFGIGILSGCADFPEDGLLLDDLIACASSRIGQPDNVVRIHGRVQSNATK